MMHNNLLVQSKVFKMTERLHLLPRHREQLNRLLKRYLPDVEVWAYGSRVNGRSHDASDLDLVLRAAKLQKIPLASVDQFQKSVAREQHTIFGIVLGLGAYTGLLSP